MNEKNNSAKVSKTLDLYMLRLTPELEKLKRGDVITDERIYEVTTQPTKRLMYRIRKWFLQRGICITHRPKAIGGIRLLTDKEQSERMPKRIDQGNRKFIWAVAEGSTVNVENLEDKDRKNHYNMLDLSNKCAQVSSGWTGESRFILGKPKPRKQFEIPNNKNND